MVVLDPTLENNHTFSQISQKSKYFSLLERCRAYSITLRLFRKRVKKTFLEMRMFEACHSTEDCNICNGDARVWFMRQALVFFFFFFYCCHTSQLTSRSSSTGFSKHYYKISGGRGILVEQEGCYTYR